MSNNEQVPLEQYWGAIQRWWWLIVASVLVASVASYVAVSRVPRIYQATTTVIVGQSLEKTNPTYQDFSIGQALAQTYINMVQRQSILQGAAEALDLGYVPWEGNVSASIVGGTQLVEISVRDTSPERARALADEIANQLILQTPADSVENRGRHEFVQEQLERLQTNIRDVTDEIEEEQARLDAANSARAIQQYQSNIAALQQKLSSYQSNYASLLPTVQGGTNYITVVEPASTPTRPIGPEVMGTVLMAAAIGLGLAVGGVVLIEFLDNTIKTVDDATRTTGLTSLGAIPRISGDGDAGRLFALHHPRSGVAEAFRTLRSNVRFSSLDRPLRTLMITSTDPGEGKSIVLANLAVVMAQEGRSVIVVDSDLRRPTQHKVFELDNRHGLSDAILDEQLDLAAHSTQLAPERLVEFFAEDIEGARQATISGKGDLRIMTSGPNPPNPADMLGSERMAGLIVQLTEQADVVLFDCPPVLSVVDPITLARRVDGVLMVVDAGHSRRARAQRAVEHLRQVGAPLLGVITNRVASRRSGYGGYSDYYNYSYGEGEREGERGVPKLGRTQGRDHPAIKLLFSLRTAGQRLLAKFKSQKSVQADAPHSARRPAKGAHRGAGQKGELDASTRASMTRPLHDLPDELTPGGQKMPYASPMDIKATQAVRLPRYLLTEAERDRPTEDSESES